MQSEAIQKPKISKNKLQTLGWCRGGAIRCGCCPVPPWQPSGYAPGFTSSTWNKLSPGLSYNPNPNPNLNLNPIISFSGGKMVLTSHFLVIDCSLNGHTHTHSHGLHAYIHTHTDTHKHSYSYTQWSCSCGVCDNETILGGTHLDCVISSPWKRSTALK